jgi:hypothetical protein
VQYIGDIDVINSVRSKDNSYSELYIHVPTTVGSTPSALFKSIADANYHPDMLVINSPADVLDIEYLNGRKWNENHPGIGYGMDLRAYYDLDANSGLIDNFIGDNINVTPTTEAFWWGTNTLTNCYRTDKSDRYGAIIGTDTDPSSAPRIQRIKKVNTDTSKSAEYLRSTLDGVTLDFDLYDYLKASQNPTGIKSFAQLNDSSENYDFEFNAILVYYDVYDPNNTSDSATNLYGIYFLNKPVSSGATNFVIPFITKEKPNAITKTNGNAFAFKINLKFDTSIEDVTVEKSVNDYSTFSLDLFLDVLTEFRTLQTKYNDKLTELNNLAIDVNAAKQALTNTSALNSLAARVSQLETTVSASTEAFAEASAIMNLISDLNSQIDDLYNNRTSLTLDYNLAAFRSGYGINLDKLTPGALTLSSNAQSYSSVEVVDLSSPAVNVSNVITLNLGETSTYYKHRKIGADWTLTSNQELRIKDSQFKWKKGQVFRLVIDTGIEPDSYQIAIKTDSTNSLNLPSVYGKTIATLTPGDFPSTYDKTKRPIIEITCTDPVNLTFEVDKIIR